MKSFFILMMMSFAVNIAMAQNDTTDILPERPVNIISFSFLGDASFFSGDYQMLFHQRESFFMTAKIGLGYDENFDFDFFTPSVDLTFLTIPHHISANLGKGRFYFECGLGGTLFFGGDMTRYYIYPIAGLRIHPLQNKGLSLRIFTHFMSQWEEEDSPGMFPFGISAGFAFGKAPSL